MTQMTQHTPTPWHTVPYGTDSDIGYLIGWDGVPQTYVACIQDRVSGPDAKESEPNARLIVAAVNSYGKHCGNAVAAAEGDLLGELLEALRTIADFEGDICDIGMESQQIARAAIAKAEGGAA